MEAKADNIYVLILLSMAGTFSMIVTFALIHFRNLHKLSAQAEQLQHAQIQYQQELLEAIIQSQEVERKRIGQDLHDDVGTTLSNLRMQVELFQHAPQPDLPGFITSCKTVIDKVIREVRHISHNLSPVSLDLYGLNDAVEELADMVNNGGQLHCALDNEAPEVLDAMPSLSATALYRIIEELLNNTIKHARAQQIHLKFQINNDLLTFQYQDDGQGMPVASEKRRGMGMQNIESRLSVLHATHSIRTAPGEGFAFSAQLPIHAIRAHTNE